MKLKLERFVPFPREAVFAWWSDFRTDDHRSPGAPASSERDIVRREGNEIWLRDRATRPVRMTIEEHVVLDPPRGYAVAARYPGADVEYEYRFEPTADGTRVVLAVSVRPRGLGRILVPVMAWWWRRYAARDLDFHLNEMARELSKS